MPDGGLIEVQNLNVHFGQAHILQGVSLSLALEPIALVGRNGMGKTTLGQSIMGLTTTSSGSITLAGQEIRGQPAYRIARQGLAIVPQGRRCFPSLSVDEHLRLVSQGRDKTWTVERVYHTFPRLAERKGNGGTQLSGGEQQMLAIARALLMNPRYVIMDEPSEGLAPVIVDQLVDVLKGLAADGIGLLLVEQQLAMATTVCERVAIMLNGRIAAIMPAAQLAADDEIKQRYLGVSADHPPH
jgi:branched-chain amino acid transport system ATP-binding protein